MFSKTPAVSPQADKHSARNPGKAGASSVPGFSILGADTAIKGDISAASDLHVDGRIEGDVVCASLVQGETSEVVGAIKAQTARLAGTVRGTIDAGELTILKSARIHGDVHYQSLTIEPGAEVDGRFAVRGAKPFEPALEDGDGEPLLTLAR